MNFNPNNKRGKKAEKAHNTKYTLKRLWDYLYYYKWLIIIALILTIVTNLLALVGPMLSGYAIDAIEFGKGKVDFSNVYFYCILMVIFYLSSSIISYILSIIMMTISKKTVYKMRKDAFRKIQLMPVSFFDKNQTGDIISKMSYDIDTVNTSLSSDLINILTSIITVSVSLVMMIIISPVLVLVFLVTIPISLIFAKFMVKKSRPMFRMKTRKLGELAGYNEEMISSLKTIQAYNMEDNIIEKFDNINEDATYNAYKAEYLGGITGPGVNFVNNLSFSLICMLGGILSVTSGFKLGKIQSFILYSRKFSGPINEIANIFTELQSALAAAERVFTLIDGEEELADKTDAVILENTNGNVSFNNVTFGYTEDKDVLKNISFDALSGKVIAIVGPTGSGKTTIVNLLMRFYDVTDGKITIDGIETRDITRESLRKSFSMVLQDTWLFEGSIYENIAYGKDNVERKDVERVCKLSKIDTLIERLEEGYDTILNDGGINISKGEKQLMTIARAMLLDSNMLILDEATSNVDTRTEVLIQEALKKLLENKTCFIIAHRLSTIKNADLILVVKDGEIIESGNHKELLKNGGFYKELYFSQFD